MKLLAPAKINLYLDIAGKRPDGYHEIQTIFQTVSLYDELSIEIQKPKSAPSIALKVLTNGAVDSKLKEQLSDERNIVWKAADKVMNEFGLKRPCKMTLKKNIPVQAGLGGGSSDAAAALRLLSKMFRKEIGSNASAISQIAVQLGADVPFFLKSGCMKAGGIGEKLSPVKPAPRFWAVIVKPRIGLSTQEVYRWFDEDSSASRRKELTSHPDINTIVFSLQKHPLREWSRRLYNGFETVVFKRVPELQKIKQKLMVLGARNACLSGSGSALYGIAESRTAAQKIKKALDRLGLKAWVVHSV